MNAKAFALSALAVAGLLVLLQRRGAAPSSDAAITATAPAKVAKTEPDHRRIASATDKNGRAPETRRTGATPSRPESETAANVDGLRLGIPAELLQDARKTASETAARIPDNEAALNDAGYFNHSLNSGNPSKKLSLRLGLDPGSAQSIETILSAAHAEQIKERLDAERAKLEREARLLADDREGYVNYLALQTMLSRGTALSEDQQAFFNRFQLALGPDTPPTASSPSAKWYEDAKILDAMNRALSPAKQTELSVYIAEQKHRDQETQAMHAQMRANQIAEQLGLSKTDQSTLLEYLKENPSAPNAEISALLPAELRTLLPAGM